MNMRSFLSLLLMIGILVGGVAFREQSPRADGRPAPLNSSDVAVHGTGWVPQSRAGFSVWRPYGWGTATKSKAVANRWVHIPLVYPTYLVDIGQKLYYVEFCAQSTNGARTKPIQMDVWGGTTRIYTGAVVWPADNDSHCVGQSFSTWYEDVGLSVLLKFGNTADTITLYKAWVNVGP